jgi:hypothetical protein
VNELFVVIDNYYLKKHARTDKLNISFLPNLEEIVKNTKKLTDLEYSPDRTYFVVDGDNSNSYFDMLDNYDYQLISGNYSKMTDTDYSEQNKRYYDIVALAGRIIPKIIESKNRNNIPYVVFLVGSKLFVPIIEEVIRICGGYSQILFSGIRDKNPPFVISYTKNDHMPIPFIYLDEFNCDEESTLQKAGVG